MSCRQPFGRTGWYGPRTGQRIDRRIRGRSRGSEHHLGAAARRAAHRNGPRTLAIDVEARRGGISRWRADAHLELAQHPIHRDETYNDYIGAGVLRPKGVKKGRHRVRKTIGIVYSIRFTSALATPQRFSTHRRASELNRSRRVSQAAFVCGTRNPSTPFRGRASCGVENLGSARFQVAHREEMEERLASSGSSVRRQH